MENQTQKDVRIRMHSTIYEVSASLFDIMLKSAVRHVPNNSEISPAPPEDEYLMGMMEDEDSESGIFVKPLTAETLKAILSENEEDLNDPDSGVTTMEILSEGVITRTPAAQGEDVAITYDETELTGMEGATSTIAYNTAEPDLVHLIRSGSVTTAMTFKPHHRAICTYQTPYMPFQVGIHCLSVTNTMETDGQLKLDYIIEIKGAQAERCHMVLQLI